MDKKLEVRLSDELLEQFKTYCAAHKTSASKQVRVMIEQLLMPLTASSLPPGEKLPIINQVVWKDPRAEIKKTEDAYTKVMLARKKKGSQVAR